jgi:hypothetical protein
MDDASYRGDKDTQNMVSRRFSLKNKAFAFPLIEFPIRLSYFYRRRRWKRKPINVFHTDVLFKRESVFIRCNC